jgi:hypothetical protein
VHQPHVSQPVTRYLPVKYEQLGDLVPLAEEGDFAFTTDDKSGYWQLPLHPTMWKYLAFKVGHLLLGYTLLDQVLLGQVLRGHILLL